MSGPLENVNHERFAQARARGLSVADAMGEAGYRKGSHIDLSKYPEVRARITELQTPDVEATRFTVQELFEMFLEQGTFDPLVFAKVKTPEDLEKVPEIVRRTIIKGWKVDSKGGFTLLFVDKDAALDRIARHLSFYNDKLKIDATDFEAALRRAEQGLDE